MPELVLLCIVASLLELDTTYVFQLTFSRGIIAGPLMALITGDLMAGLQTGVFTELLFADVNPLGGVLPPSAVACTAVTLALHFLQIPLYLAFFFGVVCAILFSHAERLLRKNRFRWLVFWEKRILKKPQTVNKAIVVALIASFATTFLLFSFFIFCTTPVATWIMKHLTPQAQTACKFAFIAVPWIGIASLLSSFRLKTR